MLLPNNLDRSTDCAPRRRTIDCLLRSVAAAVALTFSISSCSGPAERTTDTSVAPSSIRTADDYPIVWFDTPHLDLATSDGTFVRAIFESYILRSELGASVYFPGFARAAEGSPYYWDDRYGPRNNPPFTIFAWVAPFIDPDPAGISDWTALSDTVGGAIVCSKDSLQTYVEYAMIFTYHRTGIAPPANQHGNQPTPTANVYGNWTILEDITSFGGKNIDRTERCDTPPAPISQDVHTSSPGWPASSQ
jgi:hypothetical protein